MNIFALKFARCGFPGLALLGLSLFSMQAETVPPAREANPPKAAAKPQPPEPAPPVNPHMFKRFLVVDVSAQRVDYYEEGAVTFTTPASTGRDEKPTKEGVFTVTDKHEKWTSTIYNVPMPHFLRLNGGDTGLHAGILSGYPGSAGCIRLPEDAAAYLFAHVPVGTRVLIQGKAPDLEWIKAQYKKNGLKKSNSLSRNAKAGPKWKPPYPVVHTSWSKPEDSRPDPQKKPAAQPSP